MPITNLNTAPIFTGTPRVSFVQIGQTSTNVNSQTAGTIGTNSFLAFTPGANGSYLQKVKFQFTSTTNTVSSVATVFKIYLSTLNTGSPTSSDVVLIADIQAPAQTVGTTATSAYPIEVPLNLPIPSGYYILVGQTVAQNANSAWTVSVFGGDY
jgi:hypothetical protein